MCIILEPQELQVPDRHWSPVSSLMPPPRWGLEAVERTLPCGSTLTFALMLKGASSSVLSFLFQRPGAQASHTGKRLAWSWTKRQGWDLSPGSYSAEGLPILGSQCSWQWPWPVLEEKKNQVNNVNLNLYLYLLRLWSHAPFSWVSLYSTQPGAWPLVLAPLLKMEELQQWAGNYRL